MMKAMILAAGRGARLGPLSEQLPKPLLMVAGKPLIVHHLLALANAGIRDIVINISHLRHLIQEALGDGRQYGVRIQYSIEEQALETGGGIYQALPLLGVDPFIVISGDIWTDYPLQQLITRSTTAAHLVMVNNPDFHPQGDFFLSADGKIHSVGTPKFTYASFGIYHPDLFKDCEKGVFRLTSVLRPAINQGTVTGEYYAGDWVNVGTIAQWQTLAQRFLGSDSDFADGQQ